MNGANFAAREKVNLYQFDTMTCWVFSLFGSELHKFFNLKIDTFKLDNVW